MNDVHSPYGFSGMARIIKCPGSRALSERYPQDQNSIESMEGTAAHWAWLAMLQETGITEGMIAPNGIPLTEEMCDGAELFVDTILAVAPREQHHAEQLIMCAEVSPKNFGTPDDFVIDMPNQTIHVWEYKFGHRYVEVFDNWQMVNQSLAIIEMLQLNGGDDQKWSVVNTVVQPRSFHPSGVVRTFRYAASDLRRHRNIIQSAIQLAERDNAACFTGTHCMDCSGRAYCSTLQRTGYAVIELAEKASPVELPPPALGAELRLLKEAQAVLKARVDGLEEQALSVIRAGQHVPGFKSEHGQGRLNWTKPIPEVIAMADVMGINVRKDKALTPNQAIKAGLPEQVVLSIAARPIGELKLVSDDGTSARKAFFQQDRS